MVQSTTAPPVLSQDVISRYQNDGVVCLRNFLKVQEVQLLEAGVAKALQRPSILGWFMSAGVKDYTQDLFMWLRIDEFREVLYHSNLGHAARQLMGCHRVNFFYDQMFVKEPGAQAPTPWHNDLSFWPVGGSQLVSFWCPVDPVTKASSGLEYVKGSHKAGKMYRAVSPDYNAYMLDSELEEVPDIEKNRRDFDLVNWDMEPGDVLAFHPLTLHGSSGNYTRTTRRRATAFRFAGEEVTYQPGPARMPILYHHGLGPGDPLAGNYFPQLSPDPNPDQVRWRLSGPKGAAPDLAALAGWQNVQSWLRNLDNIQAIRERTLGAFRR